MTTEISPQPTEAASYSSYVRWPWITGIILSVLGFGVSAYLTYEHFTGSVSLACPAISSTINCLKVTTSPWSVEFGIPVAVLGMVYFAVMIAIQSPWAWACQRSAVRIGRIVWCLAGLGNALVLVYDELFKIDAICEWCTSVHFIVFVLFVVTNFGTLATSPDRDHL